MFESEFLIDSRSSKKAYRQLMANAAELVASSLPLGPYSGKSPAELADLVDGDFLPTTGRRPKQLDESLRSIVGHSVSITHPNTAAHLHCPPLLAALAAEVVISALNQSMDSFDQAPIATVVEQKMIRWLCREAGFPATASGTFTTGGSQSNYMGLLLARDAAIGKHWKCSAQKSGLPAEARRLRILCSEVAHFTVEKSASQLGLGSDAVVRIPVDQDFRMNAASLRDALANVQRQGLIPMAIVATAGTTDFGSIDPLPLIAELARSSGAWLHVDAAYGGALVFSEQHRGKITGIEAADSLSFDFHKLFWQPIPCSVFLLCDAANFDSIKWHADYLNPELHEEEGIPNLVTTSLLTSRRFDALKLWISLQSLGRDKLAAMIDRTIELAHHAAKLIEKTRALELVCPPHLSTVVFRDVRARADVHANAMNHTIRKDLFRRGEAVLGHTRVRGRQCLKFTFMNPTLTEAQVEGLIECVVRTGDRIQAQI